jgi:hypothetical protein
MADESGELLPFPSNEDTVLSSAGVAVPEFGMGAVA